MAHVNASGTIPGGDSCRLYGFTTLTTPPGSARRSSTEADSRSPGPTGKTSSNTSSSRLGVSVSATQPAVSASAPTGCTLRLRVVDWIRARNGRTRWAFSDGHVHERKPPQLVPLDELGESLASGSGDPADGCDSDLERCSVMEVARELGTTKRWVSLRLDELREELERLEE